MIKGHPVFGVGVHIFPRLIDSYAGGQTLDAKGHAHNAYLQAALDYGIPGFVLLIWIFLSLALLLIRHFKRTGSIWALVGLSVLSIYLLEGLTENNFGDAEVSMYFWSIQGLVTGVLESQDEKSVHG
jgi:O-antigen ligase